MGTLQIDGGEIGVVEARGFPRQRPLLASCLSHSCWALP